MTKAILGFIFGNIFYFGLNKIIYINKFFILGEYIISIALSIILFILIFKTKEENNLTSN